MKQSTAVNHSQYNHQPSRAHDGTNQRTPQTDAQTRRMALDLHLKQIILFLLLVPGFTCSRMCLDERNLTDAVLRKLHNHFLQPPAPPLRTAEQEPVTCPLDLYQHQRPSEDPRTRSLSPWRYVHKTDPDYFPSSYYEAKCLCTGCIMFKDDVPYQNHSFNSVALMQTRLFLKKEPCAGGKKYRLKLEAKKVAVGCTCVRPPRTF
ncbi:interleukin-17C [Sphaeramia orbicularis]|uniref:Interleukin-17F-like n=1 Tax=Sphaeramia orbicularis TaxID=375764 RepID=A0A672YHC2_9TELE|nr:interleukin-17F-like [Sphaeramia orbicularis]